jgi:hypothetical protein
LRNVNIVLHEQITAPLTCGVLNPVVILPADAPDWSRPELRRALLHELEHVRRHDWWTLVAARAICAAYWFNPLTWIAYRQLGLEAERACDDAAIEGEETTQYAEQLVALARRLTTTVNEPALAMARRSDLASRVAALLDRGQVRGRAGYARAALVAVPAAMLVLTIAPLRLVAAPVETGITANASQDSRSRLVSRTDRALVEAADEGDIEGVRELLDAGANVNAAVDGDGSPLIAAARGGHLGLLTFLLDRGADPNFPVEGDGNPLIMAAREGHVTIVELLLNRGATIDQVVQGDENALIQASGAGALAVVKLLVARGADVNARVWVEDSFPRRQGEWRTPLNQARAGKHNEIVDFLLSVGASQ